MALERRIDGEPRRVPRETESPPLGTLFRQLAEESRELIRQEFNLAKLEMKESTNHVAKNAVAVAVWAGVAAVGGLALTAFLILVLGLALDGAYWAGALIVGIVFVLVGGLMARRAAKRMAEADLRPDETIRTLKEDQRWLKHEAEDFRRGLAA